MIQIVLRGDQDRIKAVTIKGHAYSGDPGKDLVCAAVSSIGIGTMNALDEMVPGKCALALTDIIRIRVIQDCPEVQWILSTMKYQLKTVSDKYPEYVTMNQKGENK